MGAIFRANAGNFETIFLITWKCVAGTVTGTMHTCWMHNFPSTGEKFRVNDMKFFLRMPREKVLCFPVFKMWLKYFESLFYWQMNTCIHTEMVIWNLEHFAGPRLRMCCWYSNRNCVCQFSAQTSFYQGNNVLSQYQVIWTLPKSTFRANIRNLQHSLR